MLTTLRGEKKIAAPRSRARFPPGARIEPSSSPSIAIYPGKARRAKIPVCGNDEGSKGTTGVGLKMIRARLKEEATVRLLSICISISRSNIYTFTTQNLPEGRSGRNATVFHVETKR